MYKKGSKGWLKHFDFILLDMICLQIAFLLAYVIRHDSGSPYIVPLYRNMAIFMELLDIVVMFFYETLSNVFETGIFQGVCSDGKACAPCGTVLGAVSVYDAGRSGVLQNRTISDRCDLCDSHLHRPDHLEKNSSKQDE